MNTRQEAEIPPLFLDGGMYRSDIRTLPSSVRKIPFLKCLKVLGNVVLSGS